LTEKQRRRCEITRLIANKISSSEASELLGRSSRQVHGFGNGMKRWVWRLWCITLRENGVNSVIHKGRILTDGISDATSYNLQKNAAAQQRVETYQLALLNRSKRVTQRLLISIHLMSFCRSSFCRCFPDKGVSNLMGDEARLERTVMLIARFSRVTLPGMLMSLRAS
jgi:hypothetical protein